MISTFLPVWAKVMAKFEIVAVFPSSGSGLEIARDLNFESAEERSSVVRIER